MRSLEFWILAYLLNSLWQVPLLFAAGWLAARAAALRRRRGRAPRLGAGLAAAEPAASLLHFPLGVAAYAFLLELARK